MCDCTRMPFSPECWDVCVGKLAHAISNAQFLRLLSISGRRQLSESGPLMMDKRLMLSQVLQSISADQYQRFLNAYPDLEVALTSEQ